MLALSTASHIAVFVMVTLHCLRRRRNASSTLLWIFTAWSFPFIGPLIYLGFGIDRVGDRGYEKFLADAQLLQARKKSKEQTPMAYWHSRLEVSENSELLREFNRSLDTLLPDHPVLPGNHLTPLIGGDEAYPRMLAAIRQANNHIHLQSFIISDDSTGREFMDALASKAAEGIQVRLLYDRFGCTKARFSRLFHNYKNRSGLHIAGWTQANVFKRRFQINLRNHRKALIVDGKIAFFGGVNLHAENTSQHINGPIRDYHFETEGPLVQELQYSFLRDWYFITGESPGALLTETHFPQTKPQAGAVTARFINSGPSTETNIAIETFFNSITLAKKQIFAVTPYFVPPPEILQALRSAALRGLDVRLVVPKENNHHYAGFASHALYEDLLTAGVLIFERPPPFIHAKALVVDGEFALIGTANLDERSLNLNYETTVAVHSTGFADAMKDIIHEDINCSDEIILTEWKNRPASSRLLENLASLMTPVL